MRRPNPKAMTIEDFFLWQERQPDRYEFVEGWPIKMMTGARQGHNVVASNIVMTLGPQVKALGCRTTSSDTAVRTHKGIRYPDVVIDCAPPAPSAFEAGSPHLVVEVSSPSTLSTDLTDKLDEYLAHEGLRLVMLVEPDVVSVKLYRRCGGSLAGRALRPVGRDDRSAGIVHRSRLERDLRYAPPGRSAVSEGSRVRRSSQTAERGAKLTQSWTTTENNPVCNIS